MMELDPDLHKIMTDPGGPKTYGSYGSRIHNTGGCEKLNSNSDICARWVKNQDPAWTVNSAKSVRITNSPGLMSVSIWTVEGNLPQNETTI
jgi:hypothetical protein